MDRRERLNDPEEVMRAAQDGHQARIWTSMPGIIQSFDSVAMTAVVQPVIQGIFQAADGSFTAVNMPVLTDVPVEFPSGGGFTMTFPVTEGDECMLDFSARCIDAWWQQGGIQPQAEKRMHDLSDAVCRIGVRSKPRVLTDISTTSTQIRSDDASTYIEVKAGQLVNVVAPGGINLNGVTIDTHGNVAGIAKLTTTDTYSLGGGAQALKRADGTNTTKGTAT